MILLCNICAAIAATMRAFLGYSKVFSVAANLAGPPGRQHPKPADVKAKQGFAQCGPRCKAPLCSGLAPDFHRDGKTEKPRASRPAIQGGGHVVGCPLQFGELSLGLAGGAVLILGISRPLSFF